MHRVADPLLVLTVAGCTASQSVDGEANRIRQLERERLRALVDADMEVADRLHARDFQLVNPPGEVYSKEEYLGDIATGDLEKRGGRWQIVWSHASGGE